MSVNELVSILKKFDIEDVLKFEEEYDEQYKAIMSLARSKSNVDLINIVVLLNALVSYQLNCRGEEYWWEFSKYFLEREISSPVDDMISFLRNSKCNRRLISVKISKLKRARTLVEHLKGKTRKYAENLTSLWKLIYSSLNMRKESKTVVFSVKMFNYATRISFNKRFIIPFEIPIPLDSRILMITRALGVLKNEIQFWDYIAKQVRIPPLHIDSLLWVSFRLGIEEKDIDDERIVALVNLLQKIIKKSKKN